MVGIAGPAMAADMNPGLIDPSKTATLNVHKFEQPVKQGEPGDGTAQDTTGLNPLSGIKFKVERVSDIDLTTNAGWEQVAGLSAEDAQGMSRDAAVEVTTDANGLAKFENLPLGLYVVTEELTDDQLASGITGIEPFLVTLPISDPNNRNQWLYDVNVYPKNNVDTIEKSVEDTDSIKLGDEVTFTIKGAIPAGGTTSRYTITDQLDSRLDYVSTAVSIEGSDIAIAEGTDYTVTQENGLVTVDFTQAGREKLNTIKQANANAKVVVEITTTVRELGEDGEISNKATLFPNDSNINGIPSNEVKTKFGSLDLEKVDAAANGTKLAGAEFKVYPSEEDAKNGTNAISVNGQNTWTTDANGRLSIEGLRLSNWADGAELPEDQYRNYWIVETKAPEGYSLLSEPLEVSVTDYNKDTIEITVKNTKDNGGFELPFTGGAGTLYFFLIGGGLILVAVGFYVVNRSKKKANA